MGVINRIIQKQPTIVKRLYYNIVPFEKRYGQVYSDTLSFLNNVDSWGYHRTREYQFNELKKILTYAGKNVPYYGKLFSEYGFDPNIQSFDDIKILPYLTKDIIRENKEDLVSRSFNGKKITFKTSGSTGKRLEFYGDDTIYKKEAAYILHSYKSHNATMYDNWSIWLRRHTPKDVNELIVKDYELKRIYMSPFHLNDENIVDYVNIINKSKSTTIVTYPSTAYWLSCLLEKHNLRLPYIKAIHGASEQCLDSWRVKIKSVFGFDIKMHYGMVEKVSFAYQSNISDNYHESLTYSYTEYDTDNVIVGTSFINEVMPLIRYRTNDIVDLMNYPDYTYSNPLTIKGISGRVDDMIVSENNARIPSVNFYTVMSKCDEVKMFQIYQNKDKRLIMKLVVNEIYNQEIENRIQHEIIKRVGKLPISFELVDEIIRDPNTGKIRCVITEIK